MEIVTTVPDLARATELASSGFVRPVSDELTLDVKNHLASGDLVYGIADDAGNHIGFVIFSVWDDILYLSGIIVEAGHQGRALVIDAVNRARREADVKYLALRTQSTRMWVAGAKVCSVWLPSQDDRPETTDLKRVGSLVAERIESVYPVHKGCYGGPLYGEKPLHHDTTLQSWWDEFCDFDEGDAVICVGVLS